MYSILQTGGSKTKSMPLFTYRMWADVGSRHTCEPGSLWCLGPVESMSASVSLSVCELLFSSDAVELTFSLLLLNLINYGSEQKPRVCACICVCGGVQQDDLVKPRGDWIIPFESHKETHGAVWYRASEREREKEKMWKTKLKCRLEHFLKIMWMVLSCAELTTSILCIITHKGTVFFKYP